MIRPVGGDVNLIDADPHEAGMAGVAMYVLSCFRLESSPTPISEPPTFAPDEGATGMHATSERSAMHPRRSFLSCQSPRSTSRQRYTVARPPAWRLKPLPKSPRKVGEIGNRQDARFAMFSTVLACQFPPCAVATPLSVRVSAIFA